MAGIKLAGIIDNVGSAVSTSVDQVILGCELINE
jgi:hypothetical protein